MTIRTNRDHRFSKQCLLAEMNKQMLFFFEKCSLNDEKSHFFSMKENLRIRTFVENGNLMLRDLLDSHLF